MRYEKRKMSALVCSDADAMNISALARAISASRERHLSRSVNCFVAFSGAWMRQKRMDAGD